MTASPGGAGVGRVGAGAALTGPHVIDEAGGLPALAEEWRTLAARAAASPFESPDWLLPWFQHYGGGAEPRVLTWRREGQLVALAPLLLARRRRPLPLAELAFWGGSGPTISGLVDVLALDEHRQEVDASFCGWLRSGEARWDLFHALRLPFGSSTTAALAATSSDARWALVRLAGVVRSITYVIDLTAWEGQPGSLLGPKACHNLRTEARRFAAAGGSYALVTDPAAAVELRSSLERLSRQRWGIGDMHFSRDPRFGSFLDEVFPAMLRAGSMYANVARDARGVVGCLVTFALAGHAVAVLTARSMDNDLHRFSIGKHLFQASLDEAVRRGCRNYDFLWVGGYKEAFWHARPHRLDSLVVGRGPAGLAAAGYVAVRRLLLPRLVGRSRPERGLVMMLARAEAAAAMRTGPMTPRRARRCRVTDAARRQNGG